MGMVRIIMEITDVVEWAGHTNSCRLTDKQISLTGPDARSMKTRGTGKRTMPFRISTIQLVRLGIMSNKMGQRCRPYFRSSA